MQSDNLQFRRSPCPSKTLRINIRSTNPDSNTLRTSLRLEIQSLQRAHDLIHEFILLAALCFPRGGPRERSAQSKSAFLIAQWDVVEMAHRSLLEALCAYYNVAFLLLRSTLELLLKGAFWECLSHKVFRDRSTVLDNWASGREIKNWLQALFEKWPSIEEELERVSASIYDKIEPVISEQSFQPPFKMIVQQLHSWGMLAPIPDPSGVLYETIYRGLSGDVHAVPDRTDIGRRLAAGGKDVFEREILPANLKEYASLLHQILDIGIVIELNVMHGDAADFDSVRAGLSERVASFEQLQLAYSLQRLQELQDL